MIPAIHEMTSDESIVRQFSRNKARKTVSEHFLSTAYAAIGTEISEGKAVRQTTTKESDRCRFFHLSSWGILSLEAGAVCRVRFSATKTVN